MQKQPDCSLRQVEQEVFRGLPGLFTPSRALILAILRSYAEEADGMWHLRDEDRAARRRDDLNSIANIIEQTGKRLDYQTRREGAWLAWEEDGEVDAGFLPAGVRHRGAGAEGHPFSGGTQCVGQSPADAWG